MNWKPKFMQNEKGSATVEMVMTLGIWLIVIFLPISIIMLGIEWAIMNNALDYGLDQASIRGGITPDVIADVKRKISRSAGMGDLIVIYGSLVTDVSDPSQFVPFGQPIYMYIEYPLVPFFVEMMNYIGVPGLAEPFKMKIQGAIVSQYVP